MKNSLVFWRKLTEDPVLDGFSRNPEYHAFFTKCCDEFEFRFANGQESYTGKGIFENVFRYEKGRIIPAEPMFKADSVYQFSKMDIGSFDNAVKIINTPEFRNWCSDKWNQYQLLDKYMSKSFLISSDRDFKQALHQVATNKAVIKPRSGQKGEGVLIFEKTMPPELNKEILGRNGYLLQEFADTDVAVDGIVTGIHDIKLITIGDQVFANLRKPDDTGNVCTFNSIYEEIHVSLLPQDVLNFHGSIKKEIDSIFPGQIYTVDIGISKNGPILFELNGHTAFPYIHFEYAHDFFNCMVSILKI